MSDLFNICVLAAPWQGLNYSVSWDGRGIVSKQQQLKKIWDAAFASLGKRSFAVGFSFGEQAVRIDAAVAFGDQDSVEYLVHLVNRHGGITGVAFVTREEAERFVDALEKHIAWHLLKKDYDQVSE